MEQQQEPLLLLMTGLAAGVPVWQTDCSLFVLLLLLLLGFLLLLLLQQHQPQARCCQHLHQYQPQQSWPPAAMVWQTARQARAHPGQARQQMVLVRADVLLRRPACPAGSGCHRHQLLLLLLPWLRLLPVQQLMAGSSAAAGRCWDLLLQTARACCRCPLCRQPSLLLLPLMPAH